MKEGKEHRAKRRSRQKNDKMVDLINHVGNYIKQTLFQLRALKKQMPNGELMINSLARKEMLIKTTVENCYILIRLAKIKIN